MAVNSGPMISYSANFEDVILARLFRGQTAGFYVDVGAHDPLGCNNTRHFYELGWRGINIEPTSTFARFPIHRPRDINLKVAASDRCGEATFEEVPDLPAISQLKAGSDVVPLPGMARKSISVETQTLAAILGQYAPACIDFISIDVEGHEKRVLAGNDWKRFRPRAFVIEATLPFTTTLCHHAWEPILLNAGYTFGYFDGINRFYVREDEREMLTALQSAPINVLDHFMTQQTADLAAHARSLEEQVRELQAKLHQLNESNRPSEPVRMRPSLAQRLKRLGRFVFRGSQVRAR